MGRASSSSGGPRDGCAGARRDHGREEIGIPTFVLGGLLIPAAISLWRLASGFAYAEWWIALLVGVGGVLIGLAISWLVLRGAALASRRIRLSTAEPLARLWTTVGHAGAPPKDRSRKFAVVAIVPRSGCGSCCRSS